jgi:hypothetical protein
MAERHPTVIVDPEEGGVYVLGSAAPTVNDAVRVAHEELDWKPRSAGARHVQMTPSTGHPDFEGTFYAVHFKEWLDLHPLVAIGPPAEYWELNV